MATKHDVYPGDMGRDLEAWCEKNDESLSGMYKEGIRRMAQDPDHPLELNTVTDT